MFARVKEGTRHGCNDVVKLAKFAPLFLVCDPLLGKGCLAKISLSF